jgi:hypothetical protein
VGLVERVDPKKLMRSGSIYIKPVVGTGRGAHVPPRSVTADSPNQTMWTQPRAIPGLRPSLRAVFPRLLKRNYIYNSYK